MTTVLTNLKTKLSKKLKSLTLTKPNFDDDYLEKLFSSKNLKEIELSLSPKEILELKKRIIIYRIKKLRNESALLIQKMWNKYMNKLKIHKLSHHLTGCYTLYLEPKGDKNTIHNELFDSDFIIGDLNKLDTGLNKYGVYHYKNIKITNEYQINNKISDHNILFEKQL